MESLKILPKHLFILGTYRPLLKIDMSPVFFIENLIIPKNVYVNFFHNNFLSQTFQCSTFQLFLFLLFQFLNNNTLLSSEYDSIFSSLPQFTRNFKILSDWSSRPKLSIPILCLFLVLFNLNFAK